MRRLRPIGLAVGLCAGLAFAGPAFRYEQAAPAELAELIRRHPVAYIPAGINEWHGEQSACGLDALKAETLCRMAAEMLGGVCFPTIWLGPDASTAFDPTKYPRGTLTIDKANYDAAAEKILADIEAMGFKVAVYLSGHYPGVVPEVAEKFNQRGGMKVMTISENQVVQGMPAGDHAGAWETSVLMVLRPGLVDLSRLPALPAATRPAGEVIPPQHEFRQRTEIYGIYQLDPRVWANDHYGRRGVEAVIDGLAREVGKLLGNAEYGKSRPAIAWPEPDPQPLEVRYDYLLPYQWMERFEQAPIVYIPLAPADESVEHITTHAMGCARGTGGMVYPPISYAPSDSGRQVSMRAETYATILNEIVADLADMDFRVIVLVTSPSLAPEVREKIAAIELSGHQSRIVLLEGGTAELPAGVYDAAIRMIPNRARTIKLASPWLVNGRDTLYSLSEDIYGPGDTRVYEHELTCSPEDCRGSALLDLGHVENHCEVTVNDSAPIIDHWPPYRVVLTGLLRPGPNRIKVVVKCKLPETVDHFFHRQVPPRMTGPVTLSLW